VEVADSPRRHHISVPPPQPQRARETGPRGPGRTPEFSARPAAASSRTRGDDRKAGAIMTGYHPPGNPRRAGR
jgi:hypothetical protein